MADVQEVEEEQEPTNKNDIRDNRVKNELNRVKNELEPTTKNDLGADCISRADVLKLMQDNWHTHNGDWAMQESMDDIRALPSVTPQEPKTGHWIFVEGIKGKDNVEKCSCCGSHWKEAIIYRTDTQEYLRTRLLHCPNCGAKMIEPQESEG